jgi:hypothetical protein
MYLISLHSQMKAIVFLALLVAVLAQDVLYDHSFVHDYTPNPEVTPTGIPVDRSRLHTTVR